MSLLVRSQQGIKPKDLEGRLKHWYYEGYILAGITCVNDEEGLRYTIVVEKDEPGFKPKETLKSKKRKK